MNSCISSLIKLVGKLLVSNEERRNDYTSSFFCTALKSRCTPKIPSFRHNMSSPTCSIDLGERKKYREFSMIKCLMNEKKK
jgi:hypothetical protein